MEGQTDPSPLFPGLLGGLINPGDHEGPEKHPCSLIILTICKTTEQSRYASEISLNKASCYCCIVDAQTTETNPQTSIPGFPGAPTGP